jgi:hypothetical protein
MLCIVNIVEPGAYKYSFWPDGAHKGLENVHKLMGITDDELDENLTNIFNQVYDSKKNAKKLAEKIYVEWLVEIRNHFTKEKEPSLNKV